MDGGGVSWLSLGSDLLVTAYDSDSQWLGYAARSGGRRDHHGALRLGQAGWTAADDG
jgi:hypothetical protein